MVLNLCLFLIFQLSWIHATNVGGEARHVQLLSVELENLLPFSFSGVWAINRQLIGNIVYLKVSNDPRRYIKSLLLLRLNHLLIIFSISRQKLHLLILRV